MSGSTTELSLSTAVDSDDNADYLTIALANSLRTVDALFNSVTGHNHASAHQGGPIATSSLKGSYEIPDWYRSTGHTTAFPTSGAGLEMFYDASTGGNVQAYNRATSAFAPLVVAGSTMTLSVSNNAAISIAADRTVSVPAALAVGGTAGVTGGLNVAGVVNAAAGINLSGSGNRINFNAGAYIADYSGGYVQISQLTVTPGTTALAGCTVNGTLNVSGDVYGAVARFTSGAAFTSQGSYITWASTNNESIYCDGSMMQFSNPAGVWRHNKSGTAFDIVVGSMSNGATNAMGVNTSLYVSAGNGMVVGGTDLHGQSFYCAGGAGGPTGWQTAPSIRAMKENIVEITNALTVVRDPSVHAYHYTSLPTEITPFDAYGFLADEWFPLAPDVTTTNPDTGETIGMDYGQVTAFLFEAFKQYCDANDARLSALEAKVP